jgi:hypothetical protein
MQVDDFTKQLLLLILLQRYGRREKIVGYMVQLKAENESPDLHIWKWLASVLEHLGDDGMSSDESSIENFETVYRVKTMPWRRDIVEYMDIIDRQRHKDADIFTPKGTKPGKRVRGTANPASIHEPVHGLPISFYDEEWLQQVDKHRRSKLKIAKEEFGWYNIVVTDG